MLPAASLEIFFFLFLGGVLLFPISVCSLTRGPTGLGVFNSLSPVLSVKAFKSSTCVGNEEAR